MRSEILVSAAPAAIMRMRIGILLLLAGVAFLSACGLRLPGDTDSPTELAEATTEFRVVPATRAFVSIPQALLVMERDLGGAVEQRISLPNQTSLAGENMVIMRAQQTRYARGTRFVLSEQLSQFGGAPTPFAGVSDSALAATTDRFGDITYTTLRPGDDLVCVLAFRRTQTASRALPRGTRALDIMLRNCVSGTVEQALSPIGASAFALGLPG